MISLRSWSGPGGRRAAGLAACVLLVAAGCTTATDPPATSSSQGAATSSASAGGPTGLASPDAADILQKAKQNALVAKSGAFAGTLEQGGVTIAIDFKGTSDGSTSDVTIERQGQGKVRVISVGADVYLKGDAAFWQTQVGTGVPPDVRSARKFVRAPAAPDITKQLGLNSFLDEAFAAVAPEQLSDTVGSEVVGGVDTWVLSDAGGRAEGALYVSKQSFHVVRFTGSSQSPAQLDFSRWNEDLGIVRPPANQVVTLGSTPGPTPGSTSS